MAINETTDEREADFFIAHRFILKSSDRFRSRENPVADVLRRVSAEAINETTCTVTTVLQRRESEKTFTSA